MEKVHKNIDLYEYVSKIASSMGPFEVFSVHQTSKKRGRKIITVA